MINLSGLRPITNENPDGDIKVVFTDRDQVKNYTKNYLLVIM